MTHLNANFNEELLSSIMAKRLEAEFAPAPIPQTVVTLHESGFLPQQIAHRTGLSRVDVERFVRRLTPITCKRYDDLMSA